MVSMKLFKRLSLVSAILVTMTSSLLASAPDPDYDHRSAIGLIVTSEGTGTASLVENNILVSAAHVFSHLLPSKDKVKIVNGPYHIDLKGKNVFWNYQQNANSQPTRIPALSLVVDAAYLHANMGNDISINGLNCDIAFLQLDPRYMIPNMPCLPLLSHMQKLPLMCAAFGCGQLALAKVMDQENAGEYTDENKGFLWHKLKTPDSLSGPSGLQLCYWLGKTVGNKQEETRELKLLLHNPNFDVSCPLAMNPRSGVPGDSGGPLFVVHPNGSIQTIGIFSGMSPLHLPYNYFTCLMSGKADSGYDLSPKVVALLNACRFSPSPLSFKDELKQAGLALTAAELALIPADFPAEVYAEIYPDIRRDALLFKMHPANFARLQYAKWGSQGDQKSWRQAHAHTSPSTAPVDFNEDFYLNKYPDLLKEAEHFHIEPRLYARLQYVNWGKGQGRVYK